MPKKQRRKGNAQMASSSQAAQLIFSSASSQSFVGFDRYAPPTIQLGVFNNSISSETRNAIRKFGKKDFQTREKGLMELISLMNHLKYDELKATLPIYTSYFPKFALDEIHAIRQNSVTALENYIIKLKKDSEQYVVEVLPYILLASVDSYAQVVAAAESLLKNCFPSGKVEKAINLCIDVALDVNLQILAGSHRLMEIQNELCESTEDRTSRLKYQAFKCLHKYSQYLGTDELKARVLQLFDHNSLKSYRNTDFHVLYGMLNFALHLLISKWDSILQTGVPKMALYHLNGSNGLVCRSAVQIIIVALKSNDSHKVIDVKGAVVPKLVHIFRKKDSNWLCIMPEIVKASKYLFSTFDCDEQRITFLTQIIDAFFESYPWNPAINLIWFDSFNDIYLSLLSLKQENSVVNSFHQQYSLEMAQEMLALVIKMNDSSVSNRASKLLLTILVQAAEFPNELFKKFRDDLISNLLKALPHSTSIFLELLKNSSDFNSMDLCESILMCPRSSQALIAGVIELCDRETVLNINKRFPINKNIAGRILSEINNDVYQLANAMVDVALICEKPLTEYFPLEDVRLYMVFMDILSMRRGWPDLEELVSDWKSLINSCVDWILENSDFQKWRILINLVKLLSIRCTIFSSIFERRTVIPSSMASELLCLAKDEADMLDSSTVIALVDIVLGSVLTSDFDTFDEFHALNGSEHSKRISQEIDDQNSSENRSFKSSRQTNDCITHSVDFLLSTGIGATYCLNFLVECISNDGVTEFEISRAGEIASNLPFDDLHLFLLSTSYLLDELLKSMDEKYIVEILLETELLSSSSAAVILDSNVLNYINVEVETRKALFFIDLYEKARFKGCCFTKLYAYVIYAAVVNMIQKFEPLLMHDLMSGLDRRVQSLLQNTEEIKSFVFLSPVSPYLKSPTFFMLIKLLNSSVNLRNLVQSVLSNDVNTAFVVDSIASAIQDDGPFIEIPNANSKDTSPIRKWMHQFEQASLTNARGSLLPLLSTFIETDRASFQNIFFTYWDGNIDELLFNCSLLRFLRRCCYSINEMDSSSRDFLLCGLLASLQSCINNLNHSSNSYALYCSLVIELFMECLFVTKLLRPDSVCRKEFEEFVLQSAEELLIKWFLELPRYLQSYHSALVNSLSSTIVFISETALVTAELSPVIDAELDEKKYPERMQSLLIPTIHLLNCDHVCAQFAALRILKRITLDMFRLENDVETAQSTEACDSEDESANSDTYFVLPAILNRLMDQKPVKSCCIPQDFLLWDAILSSLIRLEVSERFMFFNCSDRVLLLIMPRLFELLPSPPDREYKEIEESLSSHKTIDASFLSQYYFSLFFRTLRILPATSRQWYLSLSRSTGKLVDNYVSKYISVALWREELESIRRWKFPSNMRVHSSTKLIKLEYEIDSTKLSLSIELPANFPLGMPTIHCENPIDRRHTERRLLMQLTVFLSHRNGSIADALKLWIYNIEKRIAGHEDCMICMTTVNAKDYRLPRVSCKQCKKRFHYRCLHKWFDTSNNTTCPLCRADFMGQMRRDAAR